MRFATGLLLLLIIGAGPLSGHAVLTHEALIDTVWEMSIQPVLLKRFPGSTADQLKKAHAYCYGGAIIQDIGYYPFGSHLFSDLTHYVRSGDFVMSMIDQATDVDELAFAIGALAHYVADNQGHPLSINKTVPELYPKLRRKFGDTVTYEQDKTAHVRTEFGFDVLQIANNLYPSKTYHDFIGFEVSKPVLERASIQTYGLRLGAIFKSPNLAIGTYRFSVKTVIPDATKAAWAQKKTAIQKKSPNVNKSQFVYNISRSSYSKEWGNEYERPGFFARLLAVIVRLMPKIGPFKNFAFRIPSADAELKFQTVFDSIVVRDKEQLALLSNGTLTLPNLDLDTGKPSRKGEYALADETYAKLLQKLAADKLPVPPALQSDYNRFLQSR